MKKLLNKFAENLLSKEQMKGLKGGVYYCACGPNHELRSVPDEYRKGDFSCTTWCTNNGY